jgi:hypothetical protein
MHVKVAVFSVLPMKGVALWDARVSSGGERLRRGREKRFCKELGTPFGAWLGSASGILE